MDASVSNRMESLKFLMVSTYYPPAHLGGDARFVEYLSNELVRAGHEVHILHSPNAFVSQRGFLPDLDRVTRTGVHRDVHMSALGQGDPVLGLMFGQSPGAVDGLRELVRKLKPEVVHWHNTKGFIGRPIPSHHTLSLYTAHDYYVICPRSSLLKPNQQVCKNPFMCQWCLLRWGKPPQPWRMWGKRVVKLPSEFVVLSPSEFLSDRLSREGIRTNHILRNFVPDRGLIHPNGSANRIVYIGVLERHKGIRTLLDAFNVSRERQGFELSVFGEGSLRGELEARTERLDLKGRVKFHGFTSFDEIKDALREAAAVVVPSESYENAPLAALEALSMGMPVIGTDIGGLPEILGRHSGSTLVPPGDSVRLAEEVVNLWSARDGLSDQSAKARTTYESEFSPEVHMKSYMRIVGEHL